MSAPPSRRAATAAIILLPDRPKAQRGPRRPIAGAKAALESGFTGHSEIRRSSVALDALEEAEP